MKQADYADPDDMFADTRMTFGEHIEDLRTHLIRAIKGFVLGMIIALFLAKPILGVMIKPVKQQLLEYHKRYISAKKEEVEQEIKDRQRDAPLVKLEVKIRRLNAEGALEIKADPKSVLPRLVPSLNQLLRGFILDKERNWAADDLIDPRVVQSGDWEPAEILFPNPVDLSASLQELQQLTDPPGLTSLNVQETMVAWFKVGIMAGFVLSSPWVFYQIWAFIAAGLYPHEKRLVNVYLPISIGLFLAGVVICQLFVIPKAIEALLWFNEWIGIKPELRLNDWLSFAIAMPVVFGISFQTPLVMLFLYMVGLVNIETYRTKRKIAIFLMAVFAAVITPSVDATGMLMMWVPMCFLYEFGILLCWYKGRNIEEMPEPEESNELVEV
jgi:sec-independent protein translocase protein TatC